MDEYFYIVTILGVMKISKNSELYDICKEKGNLFKTKEEAMAAESEYQKKKRSV